MCGELTSSSIFAAPQVSVLTETLTLGRIQTLNFSTVFIDYSWDLLKETDDEQLVNSMWGVDMDAPVGLHQVQRMHNHSFCHCLTLGSQFMQAVN